MSNDSNTETQDASTVEEEYIPNDYTNGPSWLRDHPEIQRRGIVLAIPMKPVRPPVPRTMS